MATMRTTGLADAGAVADDDECPIECRGQRRTTLTPAIRRKVSTSWLELEANSGWPQPWGLGMTASAPTASARNAVTASVTEELPLTMTIGVACVSMIRSVVSNPSIPGM